MFLTTELNQKCHCLAEFEAKYEEGNQLGEGGCGSVFAGYRKADNLPVSVTYTFSCLTCIVLLHFFMQG